MRFFELDGIVDSFLEQYVRGIRHIQRPPHFLRIAQQPFSKDRINDTLDVVMFLNQIKSL